MSNNLKAAFQEAYDKRIWTAEGDVSVSGSGSEMRHAKTIGLKLDAFCKINSVKSIVDCPCGDYNWQHLFNVEEMLYVGYDIVPQIVATNKQSHPNIDFHVGDVTETNFGTADLIVVRDCLVHLSNEQTVAALKNIAGQDIKFAAITHFGDMAQNEQTIAPRWRAMNLLIAPYNLPQPKEILIEECTEANGLFPDKSLAVYEVAKLKEFFNL